MGTGAVGTTQVIGDSGRRRPRAPDPGVLGTAEGLLVHLGPDDALREHRPSTTPSRFAR